MEILEANFTKQCVTLICDEHIVKIHAVDSQFVDVPDDYFDRLIGRNYSHVRMTGSTSSNWVEPFSKGNDWVVITDITLLLYTEECNNVFLRLMGDPIDVNTIVKNRYEVEIITKKNWYE